ncbi:helix-turn-helix domain-containing protein [Acinetobacter sp. YH12138]|uniref:LexA family protein n=1 Tax=Acinetobacter sp. YH12138 TaxID=2601122 RepID=UPI0015D319B5|nr:S24 family peptidase [Acinetobacter sp. YH12138]QOW49247.1 helix-turn-helix domain-containing protein [Acinetobacter sp. YH12138]
METLGSRIKKLRKSKKLTQGKLGNLVDVSDVTVGYWERDVNEPQFQTLMAIAEVLDTTVNYLKYGVEGSEPSVRDVRPVVRLLPVLSYVQAGNWTSIRCLENYEIEQWLPAPPNAGKNSFYMIIQGTSNSPHFKDGDYVCIDPDVDFDSVQTGEMIVAQCDGDATFKALVREHNNIYLQALNPNFQPNIINLKENCLYKGKYVGRFEPSKKFL